MKNHPAKYRREQQQFNNNSQSAVLGRDGKLRPTDNPGSTPPVSNGPIFNGTCNSSPVDTGRPYFSAKKMPHPGNSY